MARKSELLAKLAYAEAEIARLTASERSAVRGPDDAVQMIRAACRPDQETFVVVLLSARQRPLRATVVAMGSVARVDVHPREVFRDAVRYAAHSILIAHNHPSGDPSPSDADIELTRRLCDYGQLLGIPVVDHIIVTSTGSCSLAALGVTMGSQP